MSFTEGFELVDPKTGRTFRSVREGMDVQLRLLDRGMKKSARLVSQEMFRYLVNTTKRLFKKHGNPWPGGTGPRSLSVRSGAGITGILRGVRVRGGTQRLEDVALEMAIPFPMWIHEDGATIRARGKLLTIPLPDALDAQGLPLKPRARDWDNTFVRESKRGNLIIFQKRGRRIIPLYVLKQSVTIPARLGAEEELGKGLARFERRVLDRIVEAAARG